MKTYIYWIIALIITLTAAVYQRKTGPTYPKRMSVEVNNTKYNLKLVRSLSLDEDSNVKLKISDTTINASIFYRRFPSNDEFQSAEFKYSKKPVNSFIMNKIFKIENEEGYFAEIPKQAPAGKIEYYFEINDSKGKTVYFKEKPVVIRFKGAVPSVYLLPHIFLMFFAMMFSSIAGLMAAFGNRNFRKYTFITFFLLLGGGLILGPIVQLYAFGDLWTGVPFGWDLTDNKTLISFLFWLLAVIMNRKVKRPVYVVVAAIVLLIIYSIPHSMFGSQLDYNTGNVTQGFIMSFF